MDRACGKGFLILLFILCIVFGLAFGMQMNDTIITYALTEGDWDDFASAELLLLDTNSPNSQTNPYLIESAGDLAYLSSSVNAGSFYEGVYFLQTQDIDLEDHYFSPIGYGESNEFRGVYDGSGYKIDNLIIDLPQSFFPVGLFGNVSKNGSESGILKNITINSGEITANANVGGIAGNFSGTLIENCISRANIYEGEVFPQSIGGIAGFNYGKIRYSFFEGNILAPNGQYVGGIVGKNGIEALQPNSDIGVVQDSFNSGYIEGSFYTGGIVGQNFGLVENIYNAGKILSQSFTGGIAGYNGGSVQSGYNTIEPDAFINYNGMIIGHNEGDAQRLYFNSNIANQAYNLGALGQEDEGINNAIDDEQNDVRGLNYFEMVNSAFGMDLDNGHWEMSLSSKDTGYTPYLSFFNEQTKYLSPLHLFGGEQEEPGWGGEGEPYLLNSAFSFVLLSINANQNDYDYEDCYFELTNDIDFSHLDYYEEIEFEPIANPAMPFNGNIDGKSHIIRNLVLDKGENDFVGLFAVISNFVDIKNLDIENFDIKGRDYVGALAGATYDADIENINISDSLIEGEKFVGGLVGLSFYIQNIVSTNNTVYGDENVGGVTGFSFGNVTNVVGADNVQGNKNVGGIIGSTEEYMNPLFSLVFMGSLQGGENVGGIVGLSIEDYISDSYVYLDEIVGVDNVGGIAGQKNSGIIEKCYVRANIKGHNYVAGLVGRESPSSIVDTYFVGEIDFATNGATIANTANPITRSYYNKDLLTDDNLTYNGQGETTVQMSIHVDIEGFSFNDVQGLFGYFPQLINQNSLNPELSEQSTLVNFFSDGDGSQSMPYEISESLHLFNMQRLIEKSYSHYYDKSFMLTDDITLEWDFEPIASFDNRFMGRLNGNYFSIYNLTIEQPDSDYVGLFRAIGSGARIEKLNIRPLVVSSEEIYGKITGKNYVGAFAGYSQGLIWDCMNNTDVFGEEYVGGLAGRASNIARSFNTATITGDIRVGGLVGENAGSMQLSFNSGYIKVNVSQGGGLAGENKGTIDYCYNSGNIESDIVMDAFIGDMKGGLVAINQVGAILRNSYNIGGIAGIPSMTGGGIIANNLSGETVSNSYYNTERISEFNAIGIGNLTTNNVLGLSTIEMVGGEALQNMYFPSSNFVSEEERGIDADYSPQLVEFYAKQVLPSENSLILEIIQTYSRQSVMLRLFGRDVYNPMDWGSAANPYLIATYDHLDTLSMQVREGYTYENSYFLVTSNIEMQSGFLSIGHYDINQPSESIIFNGVFDGGGFIISNLVLGSSVSQYSQGLFGYTGSNSVIKNIVIASGSILGTEKVGSVVGYSLGEVTRCYSSADVQGTIGVGGIIGQLRSNEARHIVFDGNVLGDSNWGGLIGHYENSLAGIYNGWVIVDINALYTHNNIGSVLYVDINGTVQAGVDMTAEQDEDFIYFDFVPDFEFGFDVRNINDNSILFNGEELQNVRCFPMYNSSAYAGSSLRWYARFTKTVSIGDLVNGSATGAGEYYQGQTVQIIINPELGYRLELDTSFFENYSGDGLTIVATTTMGNQDWEFDAEFIPFGVGEEILNPLEQPATFDEDIFIYDGEVKEYSVNISSESTEFNYTIEYFIDQYNLLIDGAVDADNYRMELRLHEGGYTVGAKFIYFEIIPLQLELKSSFLSEEYSVKQYDRFSYDSVIIDNSAITGIVGDDEIELTSQRTFYNQSYEPDRNIGDNKIVTFNSFSITGTGAKNYSVPDEVSVINGSIIKRNAYINILSHNLTKQYDGSQPFISVHSFEGVFGDDGLFVNEFSFERVDGVTNDNWEVGEYYVGLTEDIDGNEEDNYNILFNEEYIFTITPRIIENITFSGYQNLQYSGQSLNDDISAKYDITASSFDYAQLIFYQDNDVVEECIDAGNYIVKAIIPSQNFILIGEQSISFSVSKVEQTTPLVLEDIANNTYQLQSVDLSAQGGDGPVDIVYELISGKASISGNKLFINGTGNIEVRATKPESTNYYRQHSNIVNFAITKGVLYAQLSDTYMSYGMQPEIEISYTGYLRGESLKNEIAGLNEPEILIHSSVLEVNSEGYLISLRDNGSSDGYIIDVSMAVARLYVEKRQLHITAESTNKIYGENDPELTYNVLEGSDISLQGSLSRISGERAGSYLIEQNTLNSTNNPNYEIIYVPSYFTIYPRDLRVSIPVYTKIYGNPDPQPEFVINDEDLRMGDNISVLSGNITRQIGEDVGQYAYSYNNTSAGANYTIRFTEIRYLRIEKAYPSINEDYQHYAQAITYGQTLSDSQIVGSANVEGSFVWKNPSTMPNVSNSQLTYYSAEFIPSDSLNYNSVNFTLRITVNPRRVTIGFIGNRIHVYDGNEKAKLSAQAFNVLEEDKDEVTVNLTYSEEILVDANTYIVTASINNNNYIIDGSSSTQIIIHKRQLEVSLIDSSVIQNEEFEPEFSYKGFRSGDNEDTLIQKPTIRNIPTQPGRYELTPEGAEAKNYTFTYQSGILTINKKEFMSQNNNISLVGDLPYDASVDIVTLSPSSGAFSSMNDFVSDAISVTDYKNYKLANFHNIDYTFEFSQEMTYKIAMDDPSGLPLVLHYPNGSVELLTNYEYEDGFVVFNAANVSGVGVLREPTFLESYGMYMMYGGIAVVLALGFTIIAVITKRIKRKRINTKPRFYS